MGSELTLTYQDYSREKSNVKFNVIQMTAANFDAQIVLQNALSTAILALQEENSLQSKRVAAVVTNVSRAAAETEACQREIKWMCTAEDTVLHSLFRHEIPQAKLGLLDQHSEFLNLAADEGAAFKTAFEAVVLSPAGNPCVLASVQHVGKRL